MYQKLRTLHLCTALFLCTFLLAYAISAALMAHREWIRQTEHTTEGTFALTPGMTDARLIARELMDRHGMRGELTFVGPSSFRIERLGTVDEITYSTASGVANVRTSARGVVGVLNRIHRARGWHEYAAINAWTIMLCLVSTGLLTLGASGLYLWFRNHNERVIGTILLACGCGIAVILIASMRTGAF